MINRVQVLWYLNKDDLENYCLDFKPYKSHKLEGYEICEVDEDLIFDLCDRDPDRLQPVDYFKNRTEVENYLTDYITNEEYELAVDSVELKDKINKAIEKLHEDLQFDYQKEFEMIVINASEQTRWVNKSHYL